MKYKLCKFIIFFFLAILAMPVLSADVLAQGKEERLKAVFLYNLLNYIIWPENKENKEHNLCILGNNPFGNTLEYIKVKAKNRNKEIGVSFIPLSDNSNTINLVSPCHMLYITSEAEKFFDRNLSYFQKYNILTVSDIKNFSSKGSIELKRNDNKISLIINKKILDESHLKASSKLLKISRLVR